MTLRYDVDAELTGWPQDSAVFRNEAKAFAKILGAACESDDYLETEPGFRTRYISTEPTARPWQETDLNSIFDRHDVEAILLEYKSGENSDLLLEYSAVESPQLTYLMDGKYVQPFQQVKDEHPLGAVQRFLRFDKLSSGGDMDDLLMEEELLSGGRGIGNWRVRRRVKSRQVGERESREYGIGLYHRDNELWNIHSSRYLLESNGAEKLAENHSETQEMPAKELE